MASRAATIVGFKILEGDQGAGLGETLARLRKGVVYVDNQTSSDVVGGTDTLDAATIGAAIAGLLRDGKSVVVRDATLYECAIINNAGTRTSLAATITLSGTTVSASPLSVADYSTNATWTHGTVTERPLGIFVSWTEA